MMQASDGIERRGDRTFLPAADVGGMLARQCDATVDGAEVIVVLGAGVGAPYAETAHGERRAMPGHCDAVIELLGVLRVNPAAVFQRLAHALLRRHRGEFHG